MVFKQKINILKSATFIKHNNCFSANNDFGTTKSGGGGGGFTSTNSGGGTNTKTDGDQLNLDGVEPWWAEEEDLQKDIA